MNKLLIILLAVCLVSVHAFVKRDVEAPKDEDYIKTISTKLQDIGKDMGDQVSKALDPEQIKKGFNELVDNISKAVNSFQEKAPEKQ